MIDKYIILNDVEPVNVEIILSDDGNIDDPCQWTTFLRGVPLLFSRNRQLQIPDNVFLNFRYFLRWN